jgi:caffeoyl-CoA O-methyltransferase
MSKQFGQGDPQIMQYAEKVFKPEDAVLREVRQRSDQNGLPPIQVGPMDGLHLEILTRASGALKAVEIGTLGGYSGICILRGMPRQGRLYTFEMVPKHAEVAAESFKKAGLDGRFEIFVGPALENLKKIEKQGPFDLVFIDADKTGYVSYLKWAAENLRVGGIVLADNTFAWGMIAVAKPDPADEESVLALRDYNTEASTNGRFRSTVIPTAEGLTMSVKIK